MSRLVARELIDNLVARRPLASWERVRVRVREREREREKDKGLRDQSNRTDTNHLRLKKNYIDKESQKTNHKK